MIARLVNAPGWQAIEQAIAANTLLLFSQDIPADEANTYKLRLEHLGIGFYFWVASMVVIIIGAITLRRCSKAGAGQLVG